MRIIADENLHRGVVAGLRADGHEVLTVGELRPGIADEAVLAWARDERSLLITSDRDFGHLLVGEGETAAAGVVYLRLPRRSVETILDRLRDLLKGGSRRFGSSGGSRACRRPVAPAELMRTVNGTD